MARSLAGPFRNAVPVANGVIFNKKTWVGSYSVSNSSGAAITVSLYDNSADDGTNLIETMIVPANSGQAIYINTDTLNGLSARASTFVGLSFSIRWAPY